ncbi:MAG TPA: magnesium transporter [Stenotrophobium sp.]|jgi:magnesium transporter|nr:magnesium transporter [Stenotrophobium sp.]
MTQAARDTDENRPHHRNLEQARKQVIDLLTRQAEERGLVQGAEGRSADAGAQLVTRRQQTELAQRLAQFHPADIAVVLESLEPEARQMAWLLVTPEVRGAVLLELSEAVLRSLSEDLRADEIAAAIRNLEADDIADLLEALPGETAQGVLQKLDREDQDEVRTVLSFPEDSVGAMMDTQFVTVREYSTLEAVQRLLRRRRNDLPEENTDLIVVDRASRLQGMLPLQQLVLGEPEQQVHELMTREPTYFYTDDPVREAVTAFEKYDLLSAPVVNIHRQVVGRITVDAVLDEINERAENESLRQAGLTHHEDLYGSIAKSGRNRWPWIGLNLVTSFASSRVIGVFDAVIMQFAAIATLIPIVASLGGNTGTQTMELVIRAMALDQLGPSQLRRTFTKETLVALLNGSVWGAALGAMTYALYEQWKLSLVIYASMVVELVVAAVAGVAIPVMLKRLGRDPVMGSAVILTATTDSIGFFIFLGLAAMVLL